MKRQNAPLLEGKRPATMRSCERCFRGWQNELEHEPETWLIRFLPTDKLWLNQAAREWLGVESPAGNWKHAIMWAVAEDARRIEDTYSLAAKTMQAQSIDVRIKVQPHKAVTISNRIQAWRSDRCKLRCGLIISLCRAHSDDALE